VGWYLNDESISFLLQIPKVKDKVYLPVTAKCSEQDRASQHQDTVFIIPN